MRNPERQRQQKPYGNTEQKKSTWLMSSQPDTFDTYKHTPWPNAKAGDSQQQPGRIRGVCPHPFIPNEPAKTCRHSTMRTLNTCDSSKHTRWKSQLLMSSETPRVGNQQYGKAKHRGNSKGRQRCQKTFQPAQFCPWRELLGQENLWQHARGTIAAETQQGTSTDEFCESAVLQQELRARRQQREENHADSAEPRRQLREVAPCGG